jgi:succinoglycan biosynthesis protein ExoV
MLYYSKAHDGNFGDHLNTWLWPRLAPEVCDEQDSTLFVGIGTILIRQIPRQPIKVVFGAGCWKTGPLPKIDDRWKIYCVRGPLTAARFKLDPALALADPAILVRRFVNRSTGSKYPVSFMPHVQSMPYADWEALCARIGFHCIDPRSGVEQVLRELQQTELLLAEAMHGAIVADALRVPWIPVRLYSRFAEFKWQDWAQSIHVPLKLTDIPPIYARPPNGWKRVDYVVKKSLAHAGMGRENWKRLGTRSSTEEEINQSLAALKRVSEKQSSCLSNDNLLSQLEARLLEKLAGLRATWIKHPVAPPARAAA